MSQRIRHRKHANPFTLRGEIPIPSWEQVYGRRGPMALDIGFGRGAFLIELARRRPEWNVLGLEIRQHWVDAVLNDARDAGLTNLHAVLANANNHLQALIPAKSLIFVSVNFPDPWFKKRHHKRRVIQTDWLPLLASKLAHNAELHAMTDFLPVGEEILNTVESSGLFVNLDGNGAFASESTTGISTEREIKHQQRGDPVYRLRFRFCDATKRTVDSTGLSTRGRDGSMGEDSSSSIQSLH